MPDSDDVSDAAAEQLRRELLAQAPQFDVGTSLPAKVDALVRRRQRLRVTVAVVAVAAVVAAVAVPLSSLRSAPLGHKITPVTKPTAPTSSTTPSSSTTTPPVATPLSCNALDLWTTPVGTVVSSSVTLGPVTVTLAGTTETSPSQDPALSKPELTIAISNGATFYDPLAPPIQAGATIQTDEVIPWSIAPVPADAASTPTMPNSDAMCLAYFPGDSLPVLLLGLDTGGAHCCTVVRAITVSTTGLGPAADENVGNPGASLSPGGGEAVIVTADNAFAYTFASYAASGMPVKVLIFTHGSFLDVTKQHLDLVSKDVSTWWSSFTSNPGNGLGALAAWVADQCVLGQGTSAWTTVDQLQTQGKLSGPAGWPTGAAYVSQLKSFLVQHGYCSS
ncbi:MAG: hypothetical protein ABSC30_14135 [Acidimicrobiales bacterium]|jgi:hypothetical protein